MTKKYLIIATSSGESEEVDTAENLSDANYLVREYRLAFGPKFSVTKKLNPDYVG